MNASSSDPTVFHHACRMSVAASAVAEIWRRWSSISSWPDWDVSLSATIADPIGLFLGRQFRVVPRASGVVIMATVIGFSDNLHFTTGSVGPLGLMSFGHTLICLPESSSAILEHTICVTPHDSGFFAERFWTGLKSDVEAGVARLALLVEGSPS